jgi:hypothetical protein
VNEDDAGLSVIVEALPIVSVPTDGVVALGIVGSEIVAEPVSIPTDPENETSPVHASVMLFVPSAFWVTVHSPYAAASVDALSVRTVRNGFPDALLYEVLYWVV